MNYFPQIFAIVDQQACPVLITSILYTVAVLPPGGQQSLQSNVTIHQRQHQCMWTSTGFTDINT